MTTFIERHGLVRYAGRLDRKYPRTGECEIGICRLEWLDQAQMCITGLLDHARTLRELGALADRRAALLAESPADDDSRRARRRELADATVRRRALEAELHRSDRWLYATANLLMDTREHGRLTTRAPALMFDHCHVHGWVRGLVCNHCNQLVGAADAGRLAEDDAPWAPVVLAFRSNCPNCRTEES